MNRVGSTLARLLGERLPEPAPARRPGSKATTGDVVLAYLREQAEAIRRVDPAVHQMRVAIRRMRSTLQA
jgi:hypothetical protein